MAQPPEPPAGPPPGPWAAPGQPQPGAPQPGPSQPAPLQPPPEAPVYDAPPGYGSTPPAGPVYGEAPPGYGQAPPAYGQPPPPRKRPVWPWVLGGVGCLVLLLIGGVIAAIVLFARSDVVDNLEDGVGLEQGDAYGDNAELDALWDDCESGDGAACDELYRVSEIGSEYEEFGDTCGGRLPSGTNCSEENLD